MPTKRSINFRINLLNYKRLKKKMAIDVSKMTCSYIKYKTIDMNLKIAKLSKIIDPI